MTTFVVQLTASHRLDEIYRYTERQWERGQAEKYLNGLFAHFERIVSQEVLSHPIPAEFEVEGYFTRYNKHFVYWKRLETGQVGIVTVLQERMHQISRFQEDSMIIDSQP